MATTDPDALSAGQHHAADAHPAAATWTSLYRLGGGAALFTLVVSLGEILISFIPGTNSPSFETATAVEWFSLFQNNWFVGLRSLGLLNLIGTAAMAPMFFALCAAHEQTSKALGGFATVLFFIGIAVYIANNMAFPMLSLSSRYAAATDTQKLSLAAAGEAILNLGQSHSPSTFMGFLLTEVASLLMSLVMLRGARFSKATAYAGIAAWTLLILFEVGSAFVPAADKITMVVVIIGGLLMMVWCVLTARELFQLARLENKLQPQRS